MTVQDADDGDTTTMQATLIAAAAHLEMVLPADDVLRELVTDKGFHSNDRAATTSLARWAVRAVREQKNRRGPFEPRPFAGCRRLPPKRVSAV